MKKKYMKILLIILIVILLGLVIKSINLNSVKTGLDILSESSSISVNKSSIDSIMIIDPKDPDKEVKIVDKDAIKAIVEILSSTNYRYTEDRVSFKWYKELELPTRLILYSNNEGIAAGYLGGDYIQADGVDEAYERIDNSSGSPEDKILEFLE